MSANERSTETPRATFAELEECIGYQFSSHQRLAKALTHASATNRPNDRFDYERQEFLGDRILGLCIAERLFVEFPEATEGELSVRLNTLVSGDTCAEVADEIGLHRFIRSGTDLKYLTSKRMKGVRADVVESLIASIYLDGGLDPAKEFVLKFWQKRLHMKGAARRDAKTALQEWAHVKGFGMPDYEVISRDGPDHEPIFNIRVVLNGCEGAEGSGRSKRIAEQQAATRVLVRDSDWQNEDVDSE